MQALQPLLPRVTGNLLVFGSSATERVAQAGQFSAPNTVDQTTSEKNHPAELTKEAAQAHHELHRVNARVRGAQSRIGNMQIAHSQQGIPMAAEELDANGCSGSEIDVETPGGTWSLVKRR